MVIREARKIVLKVARHTIHHLINGILDRDPQGHGTPENGKRDPYYSHIFRDSYGSGMGIVWEAYYKGVPLLGVPGITLDLNSQQKMIAKGPKAKHTPILAANSSLPCRKWQVWLDLPCLERKEHIKEEHP